jgi:hypothetical protein
VKLLQVAGNAVRVGQRRIALTHAIRKRSITIISISLQLGVEKKLSNRGKLFAGRLSHGVLDIGGQEGDDGAQGTEARLHACESAKKRRENTRKIREIKQAIENKSQCFEHNTYLLNQQGQFRAKCKPIFNHGTLIVQLHLL